MAIDQSQSPTGQAAPGLRRNLKLWQVIGLSVGLMAPSMAISINPQGAIGPVGRAIPLSFVIAMVGAILVAYGFSRLSQHFHNSGSVIGLVGATLGARAGVVAGWALAGCYTLFVILVAMTAGIYGNVLLGDWGAVSKTSPPNWLAYVIAAVVLLLTAIAASVPAKRVTDIILSFEGLTVTLIVIAAIVVLAKMAGHDAPQHQSFTLSVFTPSHGKGVSDLFLGVVFGFLSFAGFEGAAALGGEAEKPRRDIPKAIMGATITVGIFYVVISAIEVMGFGTSKAGLANFAASPALLGTLGSTYVASWFGDLITIGTIISAFGCCMASCFGASRLLFSFSRDGIGDSSPLSRLSSRWGTPVNAVAVIVGINIAMLIGFGIAGSKALSVFEWTAQTGTLMILFAYILVTAGAFKFLFLDPMLQGLPRRARSGELVLPVAGVAVLIYTIDRTITVPGNNQWLPTTAGIWCAIAVIGVLVAPRFSQRLGERMVTDEGHEPAVREEPSAMPRGVPAT